LSSKLDGFTVDNLNAFLPLNEYIEKTVDVEKFILFYAALTLISMDSFRSKNVLKSPMVNFSNF